MVSVKSLVISALLIVGVLGSESPDTSDLPKLRVGILKRVPEEECKRKARPGDLIKVHYTGKLEDGTIFDSSFNRGEPLEFALGTGRVIPGWDQGIHGMCIGEKRKLTIPPHLAYGSAGAGSAIPPDATLTFICELVSVDGYEPEVPVEDAPAEHLPDGVEDATVESSEPDQTSVVAASETEVAEPETETEQAEAEEAAEDEEPEETYAADEEEDEEDEVEDDEDEDDEDEDEDDEDDARIKDEL